MGQIVFSRLIIITYMISINIPLGDTNQVLFKWVPSESSNFLHSGPPYCIHHFEFINFERDSVISDPENLHPVLSKSSNFFIRVCHIAPAVLNF